MTYFEGSVICEVCGKEVWIDEDDMLERGEICDDCWQEWLEEKYFQEKEYWRERL